MAMQRALTVIAAIKPEEVEALRNLLTAIGEEVENNTVFPFAELTTIHFARWVMLDQTRDVHDETIPPSLVLATNYDPPLDNHLDQLVRVAGPGLEAEIHQSADKLAQTGLVTDADQRTARKLLTHRIIPNSRLSRPDRPIPPVFAH